MEAMSFTKLSDVEVVKEPAEYANVLIEEDGIVKKAPKTAVRGDGGLYILYDVDDGYAVREPHNLYNIMTDWFAYGTYDTITIVLRTHDGSKFNYQVVQPTTIFKNDEDDWFEIHLNQGGTVFVTREYVDYYYEG